MLLETGTVQLITVMSGTKGFFNLTLRGLGLKYRILNVNTVNQELNCNLSAIFKISIYRKKND